MWHRNITMRSCTIVSPHIVKVLIKCEYVNSFTIIFVTNYFRHLRPSKNGHNNNYCLGGHLIIVQTLGIFSLGMPKGGHGGGCF